MRAKLRSDSELPKCRKSSTDIENTDPKRDSPVTEHELPIRETLPTERVVSRGPRTVDPLTDTELPMRAKLRSDSELPKCKKSSTDIENTAPKRDSPRTENELPSL